MLFFDEGRKKVVYWLGIRLLYFTFSFSKICEWFSGGVKVWVQIWDIKKVFEMDIHDFGQLYV